ncbi:tail knob protein [Bacillus phage WhyPhy]|uniref:Tail knob protein n=1 Tax=Bacillus phage WhyPhy TaxID=2801480 RepID=A0A7T7ZAI8_9CAUD|nr:tail protein [Bacillus phage WhyPhy]QQO40330.1 tail knob protein [Bacillus phage WhyPhy]
MAMPPLSATTFKLLADVPFKSDYKHVRHFTSRSQQLEYFNSRRTLASATNINFTPVDGGAVSVRIDEHIDKVREATYIYFKNEYSNKIYYCFVESLEYENVSVTNIIFKLDVFQTYFLDSTFNDTFVVREHCKLYENGQPVVNTQPENLNYGSEYENVWSYEYKPKDGVKWMVFITKNRIDNNSDDDKVKASIIGTPQPLSYYLVPFRDDNSAFTVKDKDNAGENLPLTTAITALNELYKTEDYVNNVVSCYVTEYFGVDFTVSKPAPDAIEMITLPDTDKYKFNVVDIGQGTTEISVINVEHIESFDYINEEITDDKYSLVTKPEESKLLMYPYTVLVVDDFKGNRAEFKLEYINSKRLEFQLKGSLGLSNKTSLGIVDYNNGGAFDRMKLSNEYALINNNPTDVPILNEYLASYLQGNRNSMMNQADSLLFNGLTNALSGGMATAANMGSPMGSPVGAAQGAISTIQGLGNTALQLNGMMANLKDISNVPPNLTKQGSNTAYEVGNGYNGMMFTIKQVKGEYKKTLSDYFKMFGYKVNEVKKPNIKTRKSWNYVETKECNLQASIPNESLAELRNIFNNGVTLWHTDNIQNYSLGNEVV